MAKLFLIFVTLFFLLGCQAQQKGPVSKDVSTSTAPERRVSDNVLVSTAVPAIEIEVDKELGYVGSFYFEIIALSDEYPEEMRGKAIAAGDRYVFVAADKNKLINKMFIVQLEGFLPDND